jgi:protein involved in sex pheromone biosynthesis
MRGQGARTLAALAAVLVLAGCTTGSDEEGATGTTTNSTRSADQTGFVLTDLASLDQLRTLFNNDEGSPRLLLLLSPT